MILQKFRRCYYLSIAGYCMSGLSLLGIPISNYDGIGFAKVFTYIVAAIFWLGLISGSVFFIKTNSYCKIIEKKLRRNNFFTYKSKIGIINFFSNKESKIVDVIFFVFVFAVIILTITDVQIEWLMTACLAVMFLSFIFHSFFNGKNYQYIKAYKKFIDQKERKENE